MQPSMFVGSSAEFVDLATAVAAELAPSVNSTVWNRGAFGLTSNTLEQLLTIAATADLATFVFGADDVTLISKNLHLVTRDNVVCELGMFMGALTKTGASWSFLRITTTFTSRPISQALPLRGIILQRVRRTRVTAFAPHARKFAKLSTLCRGPIAFPDVGSISATVR